MTTTTLGELSVGTTARFDDHPALFFEGTWHSSHALGSRASRASGGLRELGVEPGDRVVVLMANCPEVGLAYNAAWQAGATVTPVIFLLSVPELEHVLVDSGAVVAVTTPEFLPKVLAAAAPTLRHVVVVGGASATGAEAGAAPGPSVLSWSDLEQHDESALVDRDPSDLAALMYTGGTTGRSKGVMLSHANLWQVGRISHDFGYVEGASSTLLPLPLSHAYGLIVTVVGMHAQEPGRSVLMRWFDPAGWLGLAAEHQVARSAVVPSMLSMIMQHPVEEHDLSALQFVTSGGAPLAIDLAERVEKRLGVRVLEGYGCTESSAVISSSPPAARRLGTVGLPLPGLDVRILDPDTGDEVPAGRDGEITAAGPGIMQGYWKSPDATAFAVRDGRLHTGDVGRLDPDGYLQVVDRIKDLIIRGGFNVYPRDVEDVLVEHPDVALAAVVGRPDPDSGEEVVAYVQLAAGSTTTVDELMVHAKARLSAVKYPREIHLVDAIPLTSVGKLDRKALRQP